MQPALLLATAVLAAPSFVGLCVGFLRDPVAGAADHELLHRNGGFVGSAACKTCHPDHHASWRATHHAQMTQLPSEAAVRGAFDGRTVAYAGDHARPFRDGGRFLIDVPTQGREARGRRTAEVALLVGSRRYQQYFEKQRRGDSVAFVRLQIGRAHV